MRIIKIVRLNILVAAGLLGASGGFAGQPDKVDTQKTLSIVAYIQFAALVVILTATCFNLYSKNKVKNADRIVSVSLSISLVAMWAVLTLTSFHRHSISNGH